MFVFYAPVFIGPDDAAPFGGIASPPLGDAHRWRRIATQAFGARAGDAGPLTKESPARESDPGRGF